ncbi:MAG: hypothetical protein HY226_03050 [Candidatus Vogelbacteria bacterium]|nr:hypothetical protein [Candidatus Vogelbacteria bacterium]
MAEKKPFKPFLVEGGREGKNIYRVVEMHEDLEREDIEKLLEQLPLRFDLKKEMKVEAESLHEPLEVRVPGGSVIYIHPPRHRFITCVNLDSYASSDFTSKMNVDNLVDMTYPGNGQIRSCIHFKPELFGIESRNWPNIGIMGDLEVDTFVYPKSTEEERELKAPKFGKWEVRRLIELVTGGEGRLNIEKLSQWRNLILYAVGTMRSMYENLDTPEDCPTRLYYKPCWTEIDTAIMSKDDKRLIEALEGLRTNIEWD